MPLGDPTHIYHSAPQSAYVEQAETYDFHWSVFDQGSRTIMDCRWWPASLESPIGDAQSFECACPIVPAGPVTTGLSPRFAMTRSPGAAAASGRDVIVLPGSDHRIVRWSNRRARARRSTRFRARSSGRSLRPGSRRNERERGARGGAPCRGEVLVTVENVLDSDRREAQFANRSCSRAENADPGAPCSQRDASGRLIAPDAVLPGVHFTPGNPVNLMMTACLYF